MKMVGVWLPCLAFCLLVSSVVCLFVFCLFAEVMI